MNKHFKFVLIICLIIIFLTGCSNKQADNNSYSSTVKEELLPASTSIQNLTEDTINERYKQVNNLSFEDYINIDNIGFLAFTYEKDQSLYFGFTVSAQQEDEWKLSYFDDNPNIEDEKVMVSQFIGNYPDAENRKFHITSGYVNDKRIKQVILYYPDSNVSIINLGENQRGFLDVSINSDYSLVKIECKSDEGKILYQNDFNKS